MFFRFAAALVLVVLVSMAGIAIEKRNLELRRDISRQHYQLDLLYETHSRLRLKTQRLSGPGRLADAGDAPAAHTDSSPAHSAERVPVEGRTSLPLLRWQRPLQSEQP